MKTNTIGIVIGAMGLTAGGYSLYKYHKLNKVIDIKVDRIVDHMNVDVPEWIVKKAVERATDKAARNAVECYNSDIYTQVKTAVNASREKIDKDIKAALEKEVGNVDISELKKEVTTEAVNRIVKDILNGTIGNVFNKNDKTADIIKACIDADMASWEIENVLKAVQK